MSTHVQFPTRVGPEISLRSLVGTRRLSAGVGVGLAGGALLAAPILVYDWVKGGHTALELPMAVTGWLFGLDHFVQNGYRTGPIVVGAVILAAYAIVSGLVFAGLADRVFAVKTLAGSLAGGFAFGIASFLVFWDIVLAIGRDGAPFRATTASGAMVAPNWLWIVAFVAFGLANGIAYRLVRRRATGSTD